MNIDFVDVIFGLQWGDEGKGKITNALAENYDFVCRFNGGPNAGHIIYINNKKYKTHIIPSGIFKNKLSIIGPNCVLKLDDFYSEISYLQGEGFNTSLIKVSPNAHIITDYHAAYDKMFLQKKLGTTGKGIAPAYADKMLRRGNLAKDFLDKKYLWDGKIYGKVLCEGAQSYWLDINRGNYPYVTSSETLPYAACSLGFSPRKIRDIIGIAKVYDTKSGIDPIFPETLWGDKELSKLIDLGEEYGSTTGRKRLANWLRLDLLCDAIRVSGTTKLILNKYDILNELKIYKLYLGSKIEQFSSFENMRDFIVNYINSNLSDELNIIFSGDKNKI